MKIFLALEIQEELKSTYGKQTPTQYGCYACDYLKYFHHLNFTPFLEVYTVYIAAHKTWCLFRYIYNYLYLNVQPVLIQTN